MKKRIAVLVRERRAEALRMAIGLTLADDEVTVFVLGSRMPDNARSAPDTAAIPDPAPDLNLEMLGDLGVRIYSDKPENRFDVMPLEEIARSLTGFDTVIPY